MLEQSSIHHQKSKLLKFYFFVKTYPACYLFVRCPIAVWPHYSRLVIKTFEKSSRPRPWPPGLKTKTLATRSRDQDQDLGHQVSRPRPWPPGLETKTLVIRSRDQNLIIGHKYLCMCIYMYVCLYEGMCVCYIR